MKAVSARSRNAKNPVPFGKRCCLALIMASSIFYQNLAAAADDEILTSQQRAKVINDIAASFEEYFVFPEVGNRLAKDLRMRLQRGDYDQITESSKLADVLNSQIEAITNDAHTSIVYSEEDLLAEPPTLDPSVMKRHQDEYLAKAKAENFDFHAPQRLKGNIALIRFDGFYPQEEAGQLVQQYMSKAADADGLIFDLRENKGGRPQLIDLISSYLFDGKPVHLYDQTNRHDKTSVQAWTDPGVPGKHLGSKKPVFILTSSRTYSAAEHFAYTLQQLGRAKVIGEKTKGGAHGGFGRPITHHLMPMIATSRTINAVTNSDWDQTGVVPDTAVPAEKALSVALAQAHAAIAASSSHHPKK